LASIRLVLVDVFTVKKKVSKVAVLLQGCFDKNPSIKDKLKYKKIASWGQIYSFLAAGRSFDSESMDSVINVDAAGKCKLTDGMVAETANDKCGPGSSSLIGVFAGKAKKMMKKQTPGYDKGRKLGWFKKALLKYFFVKNPSLQSCMMKTTVPDFNGTLEEFVYTSGQASWLGRHL
jgi:hypothetical protein